MTALFPSDSRLAALVVFRLPCLYFCAYVSQRYTVCIALSSFMPRLTSHSELSLPTLSLHLFVFTVASHDLIKTTNFNQYLSPDLLYLAAVEIAAMPFVLRRTAGDLPPTALTLLNCRRALTCNATYIFSFLVEILADF